MSRSFNWLHNILSHEIFYFLYVDIHRLQIMRTIVLLPRASPWKSRASFPSSLQWWLQTCFLLWVLVFILHYVLERLDVELELSLICFLVTSCVYIACVPNFPSQESSRSLESLRLEKYGEEYTFVHWIFITLVSTFSYSGLMISSQLIYLISVRIFFVDYQKSMEQFLHYNCFILDFGWCII